MIFYNCFIKSKHVYNCFITVKLTLSVMKEYEVFYIFYYYLIGGSSEGRWFSQNTSEWHFFHTKRCIRSMHSKN